MEPNFHNPTELDPPLSKRSILWIVLKEKLAIYGIGLVVILVSSLFLGLVFNAGLVQSQGKLSSLVDSFKIIFILSGVFIIFLLFARTVRNYFIASYPIIAFFIADSLYRSDLALYIVNWLGFNASNNYKDYLVAVVLSYICVHLIIYPVSVIVYGLFEKEHSMEKIITGVMLGVIGGSLVLGASAIDSTLYYNLQRDRQVARIPEATSWTSHPTTQTNSYNVVYTQATTQSDGTYHLTDTVMHSVIEKWWERDTGLVCGEETILNKNLAVRSDHEYSTTGNGVTFAKAVFDRNFSSNNQNSTKYKEYRYCFVLDYRVYYLTRTTRNGDKHLQQFATEDVIDSIAAGRTYIPNCDQSIGSEPSKYCQEIDIRNATDFNTKALTVPTTPSIDVAIPGLKPPSTNPNAYPESGRLIIREWGISIPLTNKIADAYYVPNSSGNSMTIGLTSLDSDTCFAGTRSKSANQSIIGYGIANVYKKSLTELGLNPDTLFNGTLIGDHAYGVSVSGNVNSCLRTTSSTLSYELLDDIFGWSNAGIKKLTE